MQQRADTQTDTQTHTHGRAWPQYMSRRLRLTRNVINNGLICHWYWVYRQPQVLKCWLLCPSWQQMSSSTRAMFVSERADFGRPLPTLPYCWACLINTLTNFLHRIELTVILCVHSHYRLHSVALLDRLVYVWVQSVTPENFIKIQTAKSCILAAGAVTSARVATCRRSGRFWRVWLRNSWTVFSNTIWSYYLLEYTNAVAFLYTTTGWINYNIVMKC